jgi:predicted nucleic acid-binding protein
VTLAVVDASVLAAFYASDDPRRDAVAHRLGAGDALFAPAHLDADVVSAMRGMARVSPVLDRAGPRFIAHLAGFPIRRMPLAPLLERMWALRSTITPYDAAYVALAERLRGPLITCDTKLSTATDSRCSFDVIA